MREIKFNFANMEVGSNALLCPNPKEFYSKSYLTSDVTDNYRVIPGVKYKTKIANSLFDDVLQAENCAWASTDSVLDALDIELCSLSGMVQMCQFDIEKSFLSETMRPGSTAQFDIQPFMSYFWDELSKQIEQEIETIRWKGDVDAGTGIEKLCDGYEVKLQSNANVHKIDSTTITTSNVIAEVSKVVQKLATEQPGLMAKKADLRLYLASDVAFAYQLATAQGNTLSYVTEALALTFLGIKIVIAQGMSTGKMVITHKDNLIYAFDGTNDGSNLKAVNLAESVNEPILRTRVDIKTGFYFVNPTEIVYYTPAIVS